MKKSIFALVTLGAFADAAQAQSSITLYGVVDAPIEFVTNVANGPPTVNLTTGTLTRQPGGNRFSLAPSGGLSNSRWGLTGAEDLGGGLQVMFTLENGFGLPTGSLQQGGRMFGRQAFVGLKHSTYGKLTFGRQYTSMLDVFANFGPLNFSTMYEPVAAQVGFNYRQDNTVKYTGVFGGLTAEAHWSFGTGVTAVGEVPLAGGGAGQTPGHFRDNTAYGAGVTYAVGPFGVAIAYDQWNPAVTVGNPGEAKKAGVAASYAFGSAKIMAGYRWGQTRDAFGNTLVRDDYYWAGGNYLVTPALKLSLGFYYDNMKTLRISSTAPSTNPPNPWQVSFAMDYYLSKRTDVYLTMAFVKNSALDFDTPANSFGDNYFLAQGKNNQFGTAIGIRHRF
ncbi:porin [Paraburkholderia sp. BL10I2N1]|uniref:porin n=1 Tax=Paraburkholderia sp. BL10I2N1 TaxID=1938796 RepID=UPI001060258E|nr:porin [Paraburkholderia sp. BL10I2N1]TDN61937.1 putative porin [Paraburkholderia sp. BL10I2N1]